MSLTLEQVQADEEIQKKVWGLALLRCQEHPAYFANFVQATDSRTGEVFQFQMLTEEEAAEANFRYHGDDWYWQREYLDWVLVNDQTITLKGRQLGVTWVWGLLCLYDALFYPGSDELIYSIKEEDAVEVVNRIWDMWLSVPERLKQALGVRVLKPTRGARPSTTIEFEHPDRRVSTITGMAATKSAGHGRSAKRILFDEASRQEYARDLWKAVVPAMGDTGGSLGVVSTANGVSDGKGQGNFFHELWVGAGQSSYPKLQSTFLRWDVHPHRDEEWYRGVSLPPPEKAEQYPNDPAEAFLLSGSPYFDAESLFYYSRNAVKPEVLVFDWVEETLGKAKMHKKPAAWCRVFELPIGGREYAIGADCATGRGKDFSAAYVVDLETMEFVAEIHGKMGADQFAQQLHYTGRWFNSAKIAVELGGGYGDAVILALRDGLSGRPPYPDLYRHRQESRIDRPGAKQIGFPMTLKTRPQVLSQIEIAIRDRLFESMPGKLIQECQTFVNAETNPSPRAQDGTNDDRVMSAAITLEMYRRFGHHPDRWRREKTEEWATRRVRLDGKNFEKRYGKARS